MSKPLQPLDQIIETFSLFDDWEGKYSYILDLAKTVPDMPESTKIQANEVRGCVSMVWMTTEIRNGAFHFEADSNGLLTKGMIGILMSVYQGKPVGEIGAIDIEGIFTELGLEQNLTPNRRNGFFAMVEKIRAFST